MKQVFAILSLLLFTFYANAKGEGVFITYQIKSDSIEGSVQQGFTKVYGKVTKDGAPLSGVRISTLDHQVYAISDEEGNYSLLIKSSDTMLYAYKPHHDEIVTTSISFKSQHSLELDFYMHDNTSIIIMDKPVIYLYSPIKQKFNIEIEVKGNLTFTYPTYFTSWEGTTTLENTIKMENKEYPYLFWEATNKELDFISSSPNYLEGFKVKREEITSFLEENLEKLGLNTKEKTDFITFWAPKMIKYPEVLVQFLVDDTYTKHIATLNIEPTPQTARRIYMLYKPFGGENIEILSPNFEPFSREGFTLIEWGGSELSKQKQTF